jgi:hypothetical protein
MADIDKLKEKNMYSPKEKNIDKLKVYLNKQENKIYILDIDK